MSAALVYKSLEIVEPTAQKNGLGGKGKNRNQVFSLIPENQKAIKKISRKGRKDKVNLLSVSKKLTVTDVKKHHKSKEEILKSNLRKIKAIREACKIDLDEKITQQIIERAVTRRPVKPKPKEKPVQETAFTEEDFQKFEAEYTG